MNPDERACSDCAETILRAARVCKHCGYRLDGGEQHSGMANEPGPADPSPAKEAITSDLKSGRNASVGGNEPKARLIIGCCVLFIVAVLYAGWRSDAADNAKRHAAEASSASSAAVAAADDGQDRGLANQLLDTQSSAELNLEADIKDADSAKFRNEFVSRIAGGNLMLCGEVNSKSGFGAYTGFKRFIASPNPDAPNLIEGETLVDDDGADRTFEQAYKVACGDPVKRVD